ncbi:MAG: hypothetical protein ACI9DK_001363 [Vicingaceae bacterium]|jgi:uncharacterized protein with HEPN domain
MSKRNDNFLLDDILTSLLRIQSYTNTINFSQFVNDQKTIDAVIRNFEIVGEASNRISTDFKSRNSSYYLENFIRL